MCTLLCTAVYFEYIIQIERCTSLFPMKFHNLYSRLLLLRLLSNFSIFFFFFLSLKRADHLSRMKSRAFFRAREKFVKKRLVSFGWNTINFTDANYATLWAWWRKKNRKKNGMNIEQWDQFVRDQSIWSRDAINLGEKFFFHEFPGSRQHVNVNSYHQPRDFSSNRTTRSRVRTGRERERESIYIQL